jgi:Dual specificity phosphatase, catalytic domain
LDFIHSTIKVKKHAV